MVIKLDVANALGASKDLSPQVLRLYIPNKDEKGKEFGCQRRWVLKAAELLTKIGGGATIFPQSEGWYFHKGKKRIIKESPILVYTYVKPDKFNELLPDLRAFIHRLGRETGQEEVALEFGGAFYRIETFDPATEPSHEETNRGHEQASPQDSRDQPNA